MNEKYWGENSERNFIDKKNEVHTKIWDKFQVT